MVSQVESKSAGVVRYSPGMRYVTNARSELIAISRSGEVLSSVSLAIASGEKIAIIGPSGAGKTSLLHVLACALRPSEGRLLLNDQDP